MSQTFEFYDRQALAARSDADDAVLDNVRDRALRSEAAWRQLADRARKVERDRLARDRARAAEAAVEPVREDQSTWT